MKIINITFFIAFFFVLNTVKSQELELNSILSKLDDFDLEIIKDTTTRDDYAKDVILRRMEGDSITKLELIIFIRDHHKLVVSEFDKIIQIVEELYSYQDDNLITGIRNPETYYRNYSSSDDDIKVRVSRHSKGCLPDRHNVTITIEKRR